MDAGGIALRYGSFYGAPNDGLLEPVRKRQFPIVGEGGGVSSFIHLDDAAAATVLALEHDGPAIYNIVDDEPAPVRDWLPVLAKALGAKPPRHFPAWLARLFAGEAAVMMGTERPRRLEREGQARARLDAALPDLAARLPRGLHSPGIDIRASIARARERRSPAVGVSVTQLLERVAALRHRPGGDLRTDRRGSSSPSSRRSFA